MAPRQDRRDRRSNLLALLSYSIAFLNVSLLYFASFKCVAHYKTCFFLLGAEIGVMVS